MDEGTEAGGVSAAPAIKTPPISVHVGAPKKPAERLSVCATCPWRRSNHGKKHKAGWYTVANLRRLWNGLRTGNAPGMMCHATDPNAPEYGGEPEKAAKPGKERECAGALLLVYRHVNEAQAALREVETLAFYRQRHKSPLTMDGLRHWIGRQIFPPFLPAVENCAEVALPWDPVPEPEAAP